MSIMDQFNEAMGIPSMPNSESRLFYFLLGTLRMNAKEYGAHGSNKAYELARQLFSAMFGRELAMPLPGFELVRANQLGALLCLKAFCTAPYLVYAKDMLHLNAEKLNQINAGFDRSYSNWLVMESATNGKDFPNTVPLTKEPFLKAIQMIAEAIIADIDKQETMDPRAIQPVPAMESTKILLRLISDIYSPNVPLYDMTKLGCYFQTLDAPDSMPLRILMNIKSHIKLIDEPTD